MKLLIDKIIQPLVSEKTAKKEAALNEYCLVVDASLTKPEIKLAVSKTFGVEPLEIRTVNFRKKTKRTRYGIVPAKGFKKAWVRLPEGKRLELK